MPHLGKKERRDSWIAGGRASITHCGALTPNLKTIIRTLDCCIQHLHLWMAPGCEQTLAVHTATHRCATLQYLMP